MCLYVDVVATARMKKGVGRVEGYKTVCPELVIFDGKKQVIHLEGRSAVRKMPFCNDEMTPDRKMTARQKKQVVKYERTRLHGGVIHATTNRQVYEGKYYRGSTDVEIPVSSARKDIVAAGYNDFASERVKIEYGPRLTREVKAWMKANKPSLRPMKAVGSGRVWMFKN